MRSRTVANVDSIGFVVSRWIQCSAGKVENVNSTSRSSVILATALGNLAPNSPANRVNPSRYLSEGSMTSLYKTGDDPSLPEEITTAQIAS